MKKIVFPLVVLFLASQTAYAADASCDTKAAGNYSPPTEFNSPAKAI